MATAATQELSKQATWFLRCRRIVDWIVASSTAWVLDTWIVAAWVVTWILNTWVTLSRVMTRGIARSALSWILATGRVRVARLACARCGIASRGISGLSMSWAWVLTRRVTRLTVSGARVLARGVAWLTRAWILTGTRVAPRRVAWCRRSSTRIPGFGRWGTWWQRLEAWRVMAATGLLHWVALARNNLSWLHRGCTWHLRPVSWLGRVRTSLAWIRRSARRRPIGRLRGVCRGPPSRLGWPRRGGWFPRYVNGSRRFGRFFATWSFEQ